MGDGAPGAAAVPRRTRARPGWRTRAARAGDAVAGRFVADCARHRQDVAGVERKASRCDRRRRGRGSRGASRLSRARSRTSKFSIPTSSCRVTRAARLPITFWIAPQRRVRASPFCRAATIWIQGMTADCPGGSTGPSRSISCARCGWRSRAIASGRRRFPKASRRRTACYWASRLPCNLFPGRTYRPAWRNSCSGAFCWLSAGRWLCWRSSCIRSSGFSCFHFASSVSPSVACWASCEGCSCFPQECSADRARSSASSLHGREPFQLFEPVQHDSKLRPTGDPMHRLTPARR